MALSGRVRSAIYLISRANSALSHRSIADGALANPNPLVSQCSRTFASQTKTTSANVKVPLSLFGVTGNYASALFLSAAKANELDRVESEILDVIEASKRSKMFSQFIRDLSVPRETRVKAVTEIFSQAGFADVTKNFLIINMSVLADNGRLQYIERIGKRFIDLTMAHKGQVKVIVTTVIPLPAEEEKELKQTLQDIIGQGKTVTVEQKIDPSIMGGLVVEFGQKVLDMSIKTRAKQMEKFLREPINLRTSNA
ncbi:putative H(+)-transporting two-sector ATPase [Dioscorea sansibarensis]